MLNAVRDIIGATPVMEEQAHALRMPEEMAAEIKHEALAGVSLQHPRCECLKVCDHAKRQQQAECQRKVRCLGSNRCRR